VYLIREMFKLNLISFMYLLSIYWVLYLGVKRLGREAGHSHLSSAAVKECVYPYLNSPNTLSWSGA